ncbi:MAG TPA: helix-turn-helix domain-containing protein [Firmicutes bacterium]|nr:helix-turn-helix domain-containing protein [Candidatus Fermentithermobacillaceae bacterium]
MSSLEIFARNVKTLLIQRNLRLKDLAEKIGLSESYLSLVLNGTRRNLGDKYKDRIAAFFGIPISQLYSEVPTFSDTDNMQIYPEDPLRAETKGIVDAFIENTNLHSKEIPFYLALATLSDHEARSIKKYFTRVLENFAKSDSQQSKHREFNLLGLSTKQRELLLACSLAGNNARIEWIKPLCQMEEHKFQGTMEELIALDLVSVVEDICGNRVLLKRSLKDVLSSRYTQDKLRQLCFDLATSMESYPDDNPSFFLGLARTLVKAGLTSKALPYFERAARGYQDNRLWDVAAKIWHETSLAYAVLNDQRERGRCLCKCAQSLAEKKDFDGADIMGSYAFQVFQDTQFEDMLTYVCLTMGNIHSNNNHTKAASWYKKGLASAGGASPNYGHLLMNLATSYFAQGRISQAENALTQARQWIQAHKPLEANRLASHADLMSGLIEFQRRNWKAAKRYYQSSIENAPERFQGDFAVAYHNLGMIFYREDHTGEALKYLLKARELFEQDNLQSRWAYTGVEIAKVLVREGRTGEATSLLEKIPSMLDETARTELGWVFLLRACIEKANGVYEQAKTLATYAIELFRQEESGRDAACASLWLSSLMEETGDTTRADHLRNTAYTIYSRNHWDLRELHRECSLLSSRHG